MLYLVLLLAFLIRLVALNQSLWLDETIVANVVSSNSYVSIITNFSINDFHPPFYYLIIKAWTGVFGIGEVALRMPSVIFSLFAGVMVYKITRLYKKDCNPLWAAALFLFNPLAVYYSQEARMYMAATFFISASFYYLNTLLLNKKSISKDYILYGLFTSLSLLTYYGTVFYFGAVLFYLLLKKKYKLVIFNIGLLFFNLLLLSPLLFLQWQNSRNMLSLVPNWQQVLGTASLKNLILIPIKFTSGRISFYPKALYYGISGLWLTIVGGLFLLNIKIIKENLLLIIVLVMPLVIALAISVFVPMLTYFRFLYLLVAFCVLGAYFTKNWQKYLLLTGFTLFSFFYLFNTNQHREDWKSLVNSLDKNIKVVSVKSVNDPLKYYTGPDPAGQDLGKRAYVIPYASEIYGVNLGEEMREKGYELKEKKVFRQLVLEKWQKVR